MGAKNIGDIKEICDLVKPTYGVLTAIGPQHLETFKTIEQIRIPKLFADTDQRRVFLLQETLLSEHPAFPCIFYSTEIKIF